MSDGKLREVAATLVERKALDPATVVTTVHLNELVLIVTVENTADYWPVHSLSVLEE
jgi:hypothetical protein